MRYRWLAALIVFAVVLVVPGTATGVSSDIIQVRVEPHATLVNGSVEVSVRVRCAPFGEPFESNITVSQDDQRIFAHRGLPAAQCDRKWHTLTVLATPIDGAFHRGPAFGSAFVSRLDPSSGEIRQGQDSRTIRVR